MNSTLIVSKVNPAASFICVGVTFVRLREFGIVVTVAILIG